MNNHVIEARALIALRFHLEEIGYSDIKRANAYAADYEAILDEEKYYFEMKSTGKKRGEKYWTSVSGAELSASLSEKNYRFVIAYLEDESWCFDFMKGKDFIEYITFDPSPRLFATLQLGNPRRKYGTDERKVDAAKLARMMTFFSQL